MEKRYVELKDVECRKKEDNSLTLSGYAIKFNAPSELLYGEFIERIDIGALDNVELDNTFLLYNHNIDHVLGNTRSGTLSLNVTEVGLRFAADLPDTVKAKEVHELVKRGDINGMSFGFTVAKDSWNMESEPIERHISKIDSLLEISIVTFPAYKDTQVDARTLDKLKECKECRVDVKKLLSNPLQDQAKEFLKEVQK